MKVIQHQQEQMKRSRICVLVLAILGVFFVGSSIKAEGISGTVSIVTPGARLGCSGSVVRLSPDSMQAYIVTAGHCIGRYLQLYTDLPSIETKHGMPEDMQFYIYPSSGKSDALPVFPVRVAYWSLNDSDVTFFEINEPVRELESLGISVRPLSNHEASPGELIALHSSVFQTSRVCPVNGLVGAVIYGNDFVVKNMIRLLRTNTCKAQGGWSGSPMVRKSTGEVIGVVSGLHTVLPCTDASSICEYNPSNGISTPANAIYVSSLIKFASCHDDKGGLDFIKPDCRVRAPITIE